MLLMLPLLFVIIVFGWMLLIGRGKDTSTISVQALGFKVEFNAARSNIDRRYQKDVNEQNKMD